MRGKSRGEDWKNKENGDVRKERERRLIVDMQCNNGVDSHRVEKSTRREISEGKVGTYIAGRKHSKSRQRESFISACRLGRQRICVYERISYIFTCAYGTGA